MIDNNMFSPATVLSALFFAVVLLIYASVFSDLFLTFTASRFGYSLQKEH